MDEDNIRVVDTHEGIREQNPFGSIFTYSGDDKTKNKLKMWSIIAAVIFIIILLVIILAVVGRKVLVNPPLTWNSSKLPTYLTPRNYNISLNLDVEAKKFNGTEIIDVEMTFKTNLIVLHGDVEVVSAEMRIVDSFDDHSSNTKYVFADQINYDANNEYILLRFETLKKIPLYNGVTLIQLRFNFNGKIRDDNRGIFLTSFNDLSNNEEKVIATQFEPINARLAFPCFEEPNFRTNFTLEVSASTDFLTFISSSPLSTRSSKGDTTVVTFETTPKLTINTFSFFISSFLKTTDVVNRVDVSVYVPQTKLIQAIKLLADAKKLITFYTNFFQTSMPSQKLDIVSLPNFTPMNEIDGSSNYGLIIMLESDLLVDQDSSTFRTQQNLLNLAREISNQWTGNLFNVKWWNSIWIIEGMNKYFQYLAVDSLHPDWEIFKNFHEDYQSALFYDSLKLSRPLEPSEDSIVTQNDIESLFGDEIINNKGATILYMVYDRLESVEIGTFSKCLRDFLHAYNSSSVTSKDLWNSFQASSSFPVVDFVSDWTYKSGYPVIDFESVNNNTLTALQEPFFIYNAKKTSQLWWVSLTFQYNTKLSSPVRIKLNHTIKSSSFPSQKDNTSYFIANPGRRGFYRVAYTPVMINNMLSVIKSGGIDKFQPEDLFCILNDMLSFFRSSENNPPSATIDNFFDLSQGISTSTDSNLWESVTKIYNVLHRLLDYPSQGSLYIKFIQSLAKTVYNYVGFQPNDQEPVEKKFLRYVVLPFAVKYNVDSSSVTAYNLFKSLISNTTVSFHPDTRNAIYIAGAKYGTADDWAWIRDKYLATVSYTEARRLLLSLAYTDNEDLLNENFNLIISGKLDYADVIPFLTVLSQNHINQTWLFFETNWNYFVVNFPTELENLIILFSQNFIAETQLVSLKDLIRKYQFPLSDPLARNLALVESNMLFHDSYKPLIEEYLTNWDARQP